MTTKVNMSEQRSIRIGLAGCGTVGCGVTQLLREQEADIRTRTGLALEIGCAYVRDPDKTRDVPLDPNVFVTDRSRLLSDDIDVVVELIGGTQEAREVALAALHAGKPLVTANKALIALHGAELFQAARANGVCVAFEGSCAGGIPVVSALQHGLIAERIDAVYGIVNGTCNFILTAMRGGQTSYADALADARRQGYAEADPAMDVDGTDSAHKLCILASLAFAADVRFDEVHVEGIERISATDLRAGDELGYVCKLLAIGQRTAPGLSLRVHPAFLRASHPLAGVSGPFNAVSFYGLATGHTLFYGRGAGAMPTASAVVADIIDVATGNALRSFQQLRVFNDVATTPACVPIADLRSRYYIRQMVRDRPGVLADVARILGGERISLAAVTQHEPPSDAGEHVVPIVVLTHLAREGNVRAALRQIGTLPAVTEPPVCIRVVEEHEEF